MTGLAARSGSTQTVTWEGLEAPDDKWNDWRWQLANRLTGEKGLDRVPGVSAREKRRLLPVLSKYPWSATPYFLSLVRPEDPDDPIRRQVLPDPREVAGQHENPLDPLAEGEHTVTSRLIRRYRDRAVLLATDRCAVLCRHCFRKRLWSRPFQGFGPDHGEGALEYLHSHGEIRDVLISGGDPLVLDDEHLDRILESLRRIRHIEIIRIGSRIPVVMPQRITPELCAVLDRHAPVWLVTQFNHPQEITPESEAACERLLRAGVPVNNQSVLLRGVNDEAETMKELCESLLRIRVRPYYLHQCDRVAGAEHFRTPLHKGVEIIEQMQGKTTGLAVPRFVVDLPGRGGKIPMQPDRVVASEGGCTILHSLEGTPFSYRDPVQG